MRITKRFQVVLARTVSLPISLAISFAAVALIFQPSLADARTRSCDSLFSAAKTPAVSVIENFQQVSDGIYRGARPLDGKAFEELRDRGIRTVIDLQGGDIKSPIFGWIAGITEFGENASWIQYEKSAVEFLGMKFVNEPINSLDPLNGAQGYGLGRAIALMKDPANYPIYVHCEHGIDRTGMLIALYRVFVQGWNRKAAHDEMVNMGHSAFRQIFTGDLDNFFWAATAGMP